MKDNGHSHDHIHNHAMGHGSAEDFLRRFWIVTFLLIPLVLTSDVASKVLKIERLELGIFVQFGIATIIFLFSLVFFKHAWHEIKARQYGMMTLVSVGVGAGYIFSVASTFISALDVEFYLEISTLIWVLLFGHYLEARSSSSAGDALQEVAKLLPKKAHLLINGDEKDVNLEDLVEGDIVIVKPGEKVPADGIVLSGEASVDESLISGESKPVHKEKDGSVVAGSISLDGSLTISLERVGEHSTIGHIQKLITEARETKPNSQRIADKASGILTLTAGVTALLVLLVWTFIMGETFVFAITLAITVLVIACPHALGLAIPAVTTITTSLAIKNGMFIKNLAKIEVIRKADYVVFDKTGTLTQGEFGVDDIFYFADNDEQKVLSIAASLEKNSSHIIALSIVKYAKESNTKLKPIRDFKNIAGKGIEASIDGASYKVGNELFIRGSNITLTREVERVYEKLLGESKTVVFVADKSTVIGLISLFDKVKEESAIAVKSLHDLDIKVAMLTGDNKEVAKSVAKEIGIDIYFAEVLPEDKYKHIKSLQDKGNVVLMVGDGINDAPALTQADAGIAIGAGTDVAIESGDVVLMRNNPEDVVRLVTLSKKVYQKMIQNLVWAFGYNIIAIPAAAGVFAYWGFFLRPEIGAFVMSLSTVVVVVNAMMLKRVKL